MKNAQDAVKEIREWPKLDVEYLVEHEGGDIQFTSEYPGRVVCTKCEFIEAKIEQNPTMADAVRALDGNIRKARIRDDHGGLKYSDIVVLKVGGPDRWRVYRPTQILTRTSISVGTIEEFEAEAKRMGYKSDRERWVEAALESSWNPCPSDDRKKLEYIYDALISGELPIPEAK